MIYQINKSRLDEVIMNYLDSVFFGMEEHHYAIGKAIYHWWGIGNHEMIDIDNSHDDVFAMGIEDSIWQGVRGMFNLAPIQTDEYFMRWIQKNLELFPSEIYTF